MAITFVQWQIRNDKNLQSQHECFPRCTATAFWDMTARGYQALLAAFLPTLFLLRSPIQPACVAFFSNWPIKHRLNLFDERNKMMLESGNETNQTNNFWASARAGKVAILHMRKHSIENIPFFGRFELSNSATVRSQRVFVVPHHGECGETQKWRRSHPTKNHHSRPAEQRHDPKPNGCDNRCSQLSNHVDIAFETAWGRRAVERFDEISLFAVRFADFWWNPRMESTTAPILRAFWGRFLLIFFDKNHANFTRIFTPFVALCVKFEMIHPQKSST